LTLKGGHSSRPNGFAFTTKVNMENSESPEVTSPNPLQGKSTADYDGDDLWPPYCNPSYVMPERIEVKVNIKI